MECSCKIPEMFPEMYTGKKFTYYIKVAVEPKNDGPSSQENPSYLIIIVYTFCYKI